jgi:pyrroloquinoline quinone biosynthesis protein B
VIELRCLGSAAGGGYPQWDCACASCAAARVEGRSSRQDSFAVSGDGRRWWLLNASADVVQQINASPDLLPGPGVRDTPVVGVLLTDAELDHIGGLLELRHAKSITIAAAPGVLSLVRDQLALDSILSSYCEVTWLSLPEGSAVRLDESLLVTTVPIGHRRPRYAPATALTEGCNAACVTALRLQPGVSSGGVLYAPTLPTWSSDFGELAGISDAVFVDGTFWQEGELVAARADAKCERPTQSMGHLPISGPRGSLEQLSCLKTPVKVYVHLNNTNPAWGPFSSQAAELARSGVIVAKDGMAWHL